MRLDFTNRIEELRVLDTIYKNGELVIICGRRRIGKTRLLTKWLDANNGLYSQAIEGSPQLQLKQVFQDIKHRLTTAIEPKTWEEIFELIDLQKGKIILCIDEFPYLVDADPTLPSRFQKWFDHSKKRDKFIILSGSSHHMMHGIFLDNAAPLYGRADKILNINSMSYAHFCQALHLDKTEIESFIKFSIVGGIPKYWELLNRKWNSIQIVNDLYFSLSAYMEDEPSRILADEHVRGINPRNVLELIGRGAERLSEISSRLETPATNLTRIIQQLLEVSLLSREIPFGESIRTTKRSLYKIKDPCLRFWFRVYSPHRTRWRTYDNRTKKKLLLDHASLVFEDFVRESYSNGCRYWEGDLEIDLVREAISKKQEKKIIVSEIKLKKLSHSEKGELIHKLKLTFARSKLAPKYPNVTFEIADSTFLK